MRDYINSYLKEAGIILDRIDREELHEAMNILFDAWKNGKHVFVMGNGGSASTASHFAADLSKTSIVQNKNRFKVVSLVDNIPLVSAWANDSGWAAVFEEQLKPWLAEDDVLVGFSVHGGSGNGEAGPWSQNLVRAVSLAKERKAKIIGFSGFDGGYIKTASDACITVPMVSDHLGTPMVESFHVMLHHLIVFGLKEMIKNE